jgi:Amt family ammonium transporter
LLGNHWFFIKQVAATVFSSFWAFGFTLGMLKVIDWITPVKVTKETEEMGLDSGLHGEHAYEDVFTPAA